MNEYTLYGLAQETGLDYPSVVRVVKRMNLKPVGTNYRGKDTYDLAEFTTVLQTYKDKWRSNQHGESEEPTQGSRPLEDERLEEIIRGLKLKNDELEKKLVSTQYVKDYLVSYRMATLTQLKDILTNRFPNQGDCHRAIKLRQLGTDFYNDLVLTMNKYTQDWITAHRLKDEPEQPEDFTI